jgi:hypothetical protein
MTGENAVANLDYLGRIVLMTVLNRVRLDACSILDQCMPATNLPMVSDILPIRTGFRGRGKLHAHFPKRHSDELIDI